MSASSVPLQIAAKILGARNPYLFRPKMLRLERSAAA